MSEYPPVLRIVWTETIRHESTVPIPSSWDEGEIEDARAGYTSEVELERLLEDGDFGFDRNNGVIEHVEVGE